VSATEILGELQRRGVSVTADGDALVLKPRRAIDGELLARVREHKPEIIRALSAHPATCSPTCYEVEPGTWLHRPWEGCATASVKWIQ
jgi:TubC N-terminal docking domain